MTDETARLQKGDKVYIRTWNTFGVVTHARPADFVDDEIYEVQARPHYFRRGHLELHTTENGVEARKNRRAQKEARVVQVRNQVFELMREKRPVAAELIIEFLQAQSEWLEELGYGPTLVDSDMTPRVKPSRTEPR
jgi:hypothetical protein